jgi:hypothetical protein
MREWFVGPRPFLCHSYIGACLDVWRFTCQWLCNVARCHISIRLSVLRQPAHQSAAPKCHSPLHRRAVRPQGGQRIMASRDQHSGHGSEVCESTSPVEGCKWRAACPSAAVKQKCSSPGSCRVAESLQTMFIGMPRQGISHAAVKHLSRF